MVRLSLFLMIMVFLRVAPVFGYGGSIGLFATPAGNSCAILQTPITQPSILHTGHDATTGASFSAPVPNCGGLVFLVNVMSVAVVTGDTQNGVVVDYGACDETGSVLVGSIFTQLVFPTVGCCAWTVDCAGVSELASAGCAVVSLNTGLCGCYACAAAVQQASWGSIKELFRVEAVR